MDAWNTIVSSWVPAYFQVQALSYREGTQSKGDSFPWLAHEMQERDPELEKIPWLWKKTADPMTQNWEGSTHCPVTCQEGSDLVQSIGLKSKNGTFELDEFNIFYYHLSWSLYVIYLGNI